MKSLHPRFKSISSSQLKLVVRQSIIHVLEAEPQPALIAPSTAPVQIVQASSQNPPTHVLMVCKPSPSADECGEIIEFLDSNQWQEHQASVATSTALAPIATASPEATDQQHKRARRIAHPSDPLTPSTPEIAPVQPERCVASKALRTTTTAAEDCNGTPKELLVFNPPPNLTFSPA